MGAQRHKVKAGKGNKNTLKAPQVAFLTPVPGTEVRYFVNLPEREHQGGARATVVIAGAPGTKLYLAIDRGKPPELDGQAVELSQRAFEARLEEHEVEVGTLGLAQVTVLLSHLGGARCRVGAALEEKVRDGFQYEDKGPAGLVWSGWFESWRRLYLEVDGMRRPPGQSGTFRELYDVVKGQVAREFARAFLELAPAGRDAQPPHRLYVHNTTKEAEPYASGYEAGAAHRPRYLHLLFVDTLADDPIERGYDLRMTGRVTEATVAKVDDEVFDTSKRSAWYLRHYVFVDDEELPSMFSRMVESELKLDGDDWKLRIDLGGLSSVIDVHDAVVRVQVWYKGWDIGSGVSVGKGETTLVGVRFREDMWPSEAQRSLLKTTVHEIGHALGLAHSELPTGASLTGPDFVGYKQPSKRATHASPTYYYQGMHCHRDRGGGSGQGCIMFHANAFKSGGVSVTPQHFCDVCLLGLRASNLEELPVAKDEMGFRYS
ncbi:MAG: hypothetical protein AB7N76_28555 [Planctomycetota bacterium]